MQKHIYCSASMTQKLHDIFVAYVLAQSDATEYIVYLTSPGGVPLVGFNLYSFIKARPEKTTIYNMAYGDSAALQFFLGFKHRYSTPIGSFLIHPITFSKDMVPQQYTRENAALAAKDMEAIEATTAQIIVSETVARAQKPLTVVRVRQYMSKSHRMGVAEALKCGIIDDVSEPNFPATGVVYLTDASVASLP